MACVKSFSAQSTIENESESTKGDNTLGRKLHSRLLPLPGCLHCRACATVYFLFCVFEFDPTWRCKRLAPPKLIFSSHFTACLSVFLVLIVLEQSLGSVLEGLLSLLGQLSSYFLC